MKHYFKIGLLFFVLALTACGFHLRGTQRTMHLLTELSIQPNDPTEYFQRVFRRYLRDIDVKVVPADSGKYVIRLKPEHYVREVLVIGTDAEAKQEYLLYTIFFEILSPISGPMGEQSVQVNRMLNLDPSRILGQNQEETVLIGEMREEASMQVYYRVNVVASRERKEQAEQNVKTKPAQDVTP